MKKQSKKTRTKHIEQWQASGLRQAKYCRKHGIHPSTFSGWLRRASKEIPKKQNTDPVAALIPLELEPSSELEGKPIKLFVGERCELLLEKDFCQATLKQLLEVFES